MYQKGIYKSFKLPQIIKIIKEKGFNPIEELNLPQDRKQYLEKAMKEFTEFSDKIMNKGK